MKWQFNLKRNSFRKDPTLFRNLYFIGTNINYFNPLKKLWTILNFSIEHEHNLSENKFSKKLHLKHFENSKQEQNMSNVTSSLFFLGFSIFHLGSGSSQPLNSNRRIWTFMLFWSLSTDWSTISCNFDKMSLWLM